MTAVGDTLFFAARDPIHGTELWESRGTPGTTVMVRDIFPGRGSSYPASLKDAGGVLYFTASDGRHGTELWRTRGTAASTVMVRDILPGPNSSLFGFGGELAAVRDTVFFAADDGVHGVELWASDGTSAGTRLVRDIATTSGTPGAGAAQPPMSRTPPPPTATPTVLPSTGPPEVPSSYPFAFISFRGKLYFLAIDDTLSVRLWRSDGTKRGTVPVSTVDVGTSATVSGTLFFEGWDSRHGEELWTSDGTGPGTHRLKDIWPGRPSSNPVSFAKVRRSVFFAARSPGAGYEPWMSDGTPAGTRLVSDLAPGKASSFAGGFTRLGDEVLFMASAGPRAPAELWSVGVHGTGLQRVLPVAQGGPWEPHGFTRIGRTVYFAASDRAHGTELWKTDGTTAGTMLVRDIDPGTKSARPIALTNVGGTLFFVANATLQPRDQLWRSDGTRRGTVRVATIGCPGPCSTTFPGGPT